MPRAQIENETAGSLRLSPTNRTRLLDSILEAAVGVILSAGKGLKLQLKQQNASIGRRTLLPFLTKRPIILKKVHRRENPAPGDSNSWTGGVPTNEAISAG